ncbi:MAG: ISL3 family transposase [Acidobacteriota bacterium]|nr:ISL3 family transposase [Acidobacteriota bacterium]
MAAHVQLLLLSDEIDDVAEEVNTLLDDIWIYTPDFLDLPYWRTIAYKKSEHDYEVMAEPLTLPECPACGQTGVLTPTGTIVQRVRDEPREHRRVVIHFIRQRFRCSCGRNLLQPLAGIAEGRSITVRGAVYTALECFARSFDEVAERVGISSKTVKEIFADLICMLDAARTVEAPEALGIDGVCVGRRKYKRSYCLLTDISNSRVLELLSRSTQLEVARFLKQLPRKERIKVVAIDMSKGFLNVVERILPRAKVVIDPFHVVRMLNDAVSKVVKMKQKGLTSTEHKKLMKGGNRFLLLKRRFELTGKEKSQLNAWFEAVPEFRQAYDLKEAGYDIYKATTRHRAEKRFEEWRASIPENLETAFRGFIGTVGRWRKYIFNYFDYMVSNALTESKNRDIKSLQRQGRRTSFPVLRAKLVYAGVARKPARPKSEIKAKHIRSAMKEASAKRQFPDTWDPNSYVARINNARKNTNEFSRLLRPVQGWEERFKYFSYYSKEKSPYKWDFIWPVSAKPKRSGG